MLEGTNTVGYQETAKGTKTFSTINPVTNTHNTLKLYEATQEEVAQACLLAAQAFKMYRNTPALKRSAFLHTIVTEILNLEDVLLETYMAESGLPRGRAEGERGRMLAQLTTFADLVATDAWREVDTTSADNATKKVLIPIGPVVVFGASNFPFAFSTGGGDTASALAAGNPVIVKSHPMHAETSKLVARAITNAAHKTGMPEGVFSHLNSSDNAVGKALVTNPHIKAVGFTGSLKGGRALYDLAATRKEPIPVFAEMGSINPVVITEKALQTRAAEIANMMADSITLGMGQFCTNPGLIILENTETAIQFIEVVGDKLAKKPTAAMLHPSIYNGYTNNKNELTAQPDVIMVNEAEKTNYPNAPQAAIAKVSAKAFIENAALHKEVFGPFSLAVLCENRNEMETVLTHLEGQLTGTIIAEKADYHQLDTLVDALQEKVGRLVFNGVPTGVEVCPAMTHGGPYPASTDSRFTAVGTGAIKRWVRPFSYQNVPAALLPSYLK